VSLVEHDDVIQTFSADRPNQSFDVRRLPGRPGSNSDFLQTQGSGAVLELHAVNAVAVPQQILRGRRKGDVGGGVKMLLARRFENVAPCRAADAKTATGF